MKMKISGIVAATVASIALTNVAPIRACAPLAQLEQSKVEVVDESAVIVWDKANQTEHFIRRATFDATGKSIGFIVPTPSVPQLAAANNEVFKELTEAIRPQLVDRPYNAYGLDLFIRGQKISNEFKAAGTYLTDSIEVVRTQQVGAYDATVCERPVLAS